MRRRAAVAWWAVAAVLATAVLGLAGCARKRPAAAAPSLPPRQLGEATQEELVATARDSNVVICVLDAARADRFGCYGYPRDTTPNTDRLARESILFRNHFSTCSATEPSTASLFTGLYADTHRVMEQGGLSPGTFTLPEALKAKGLRSYLFTSNLVVSPELHLEVGLEQVFPRSFVRGEKAPAGPPEGEYWRTPEGLSRSFGQWLRKKKPGRFLAYLHFLPPHNPYDAPETFTAAVAKRPAPPARRGHYEFTGTAPFYGVSAPTTDQYDANLRWGDWGVGEVVRLLREQGLLDDTLLIVTADHGEAFGEHGYLFHAFAVYDEFVHIPLLIRFPGRQRLVGEVTALTQTVDVLPTICDLLQASYPRDQVQGRSLLPVLAGAKDGPRDYVFATTTGPKNGVPNYLVRTRGWSLILYEGGQMRALYDLQHDPGQRQNVIAAHPEEAAKLVSAFRAFAPTQKVSLEKYLSPTAAAQAPPPRPKLSERQRKELRALGYLK